LKGGNDVFERSFERIRITGTEFVVPDFYHLSNTTTITTNQFITKSRLVGVFGDLMLNYNGFAYFNLTGRNDMSSTLPAENRSFFYPAVNIGLVISEIVNLPEFVTYGKLRASVAEVGLDTSPYRTAVTYASVAPFPINDVLGFGRNVQKGSPTLRPEKSTSIEIGADFSFVKNRYGLDFTYYKSNSKDQILVSPISVTTGYTSAVLNSGEIQNNGIEMILRGTPIQNSNFRWDVNVNFTRNRNEILSVSDELDEIILASQFGYVGSGVTMKLVKGTSYGTLYGSSMARYYEGGIPENRQVLDRSLPLLIGANGFPVMDATQLALGNTQPDWLMGIRNTFTYKNINLSFLIDGRFGVDQYSQFDNFYASFAKLDFADARNDVVIFSGFRADGTPNDIPVWLGQALGPDGLNYGAGYWRNAYRQMSENFVKDASFIKLRNITIGYSLPKKLIGNTPFRAIDVSASANNMILWTPWRGYDPESFSEGAGSNATGFTGLGHPGIMSFLFSVNFSL
jgi:outer membrane receptor protein involved in Fe transport